MKEFAQQSLCADDPGGENPDYLSRQLLTYIGNKRALLGLIGGAVERVRLRLGKRQLRTFDIFSGSGVVSRFLKAHSSYLVSNDLEDYAVATSRCYLRNKRTVDFTALSRIVDDLNRRVVCEPLPPGFIEELYAPRDEQSITRKDRVFYTRLNARRLDTYRRLLGTLPKDTQELLMGPLLSRASVHANTAGVFKGFYKNKATQVGQFGGSGSDALVRITGEIQLDVPVLSEFECEYDVLQQDANLAARCGKQFDLAYVDPPYNQHPYGSNYFMLNLLLRYERPSEVSRVSGIPIDWKRSGYNVRAQSLALLTQLLSDIEAPFILVSFNNEGFISIEDMRVMLGRLGSIEVMETQYNAFRGSRNFANRPIHVTEHLFLVERK